ncbi:unnamed protein product, partial [Meganyctiphanes norvegica]
MTMMLLVMMDILFHLGLASSNHYEPDWDSLDSRPLPPWYDDAKVGIFIHWGVFSVPSFGVPNPQDSAGGKGATGEWFWNRWENNETHILEFMKDNYPPDFTYQDFAPQLTAEFFDPVHWAQTFEASGAKYVVLTSKHHEGYTLWPSKYSWNWNAMDVGPHRDVVGEFAQAIKTNTSLTFGLYHSRYEWFNSMYLEDKSNNFSTQDFVFRKTLPELYEIVNAYEPEVIFSDGDWEAPDTYWNSTTFLVWLFNESPVKDTVVVNDRWGKGCHCKHGSYLTCNDRYNPGVLQQKKWENALTFDRYSWGFRRNANMSDYLNIEEVLEQLVSTVSCGGNMLINIGPRKDGMLPAIMEERLLQMGTWLGINGESIYASRPWTHQNDTLTPGVWYTSKADAVYAIVLNWPENNILTLGSVKSTPSSTITMFGYDGGKLKFVEGSSGLEVTFPWMNHVTSEWAWVLEMKGVQPVAPTKNTHIMY